MRKPIFLFIILLATIALSAFECRAQSGADYIEELDCYPPDKGQPKAEKACLRQLGDVASRQGDTLTLKLSARKIKKYQSNSAACESGQAGDDGKCIVYSLAGFFRQHQTYAIRYGLYEGGGWILVRRSDGSETTLEAEPRFSPDGTRFAVVSGDDAGYSANRIEIWHMPENSPPILEFRYDVPIESYELHEFKFWDGNDRVKMTVVMKMGDELITAGVNLLRMDGSWKRTPPTIESDK